MYYKYQFLFIFAFSVQYLDLLLSHIYIYVVENVLVYYTLNREINIEIILYLNPTRIQASLPFSLSFTSMIAQIVSCVCARDF